MSARIVFTGPELRPERAAEIFCEVAPLVVGRPLALREGVGASSSGGGTCWRRQWDDGDVSVIAGVAEGHGNPRDGDGYLIDCEIKGPYDGKLWWRATLHQACGTAPILGSPLAFDVLGLSPAAFDAVRARIAALLPEHRDVTFEDAYAVRCLVEERALRGEHDWLRDFLARPILPHHGWASAALCERKIALRGLDVETARTWTQLAPESSRAWEALADVGGGPETSAAEARWLAALTHPFALRAIEAAGEVAPLPSTALAAAMAHVFHDPRWRWLDARDRDGFAAAADAWRPAPSRRLTLARPVSPNRDALTVEIARAAGFEGARWIPGRAAIYGPPLAPPGTLSARCGVGTGHSVRSAEIALAAPSARSRVVATCHTNCEDRLASFGLVWCGPERQIVWRTSLAGEPPLATQSPVEVDVIDGGDGRWGDAALEALSARRP